MLSEGIDQPSIPRLCMPTASTLLPYKYSASFYWMNKFITFYAKSRSQDNLETGNLAKNKINRKNSFLFSFAREHK